MNKENYVEIHMKNECNGINQCKTRFNYCSVFKCQNKRIFKYPANSIQINI